MTVLSTSCGLQFYNTHDCKTIPDSKVHVANMRPTWVLSAPDGPHVGPMNLATRDHILATRGSLTPRKMTFQRHMWQKHLIYCSTIDLSSKYPTGSWACFIIQYSWYVFTSPLVHGVSVICSTNESIYYYWRHRRATISSTQTSSSIIKWVYTNDNAYFLQKDNLTIQYIPRNMHTVLLCFALLWLCNRS